MRALGFCCVLAVLLPAAVTLAGVDEDVLDTYSLTGRFRSGQPAAVVVTRAGREVFFLRSGPRSRVQDLWCLDTRSGSELTVVTAGRLLAGGEEQLTPEDRARRERLRQSARGIAAFSLSRDERRLLVPLSGRLFVLERTASGWGEARELGPGGSPAMDARFSPDGAQVACVRDGDVHVIDVASGVDRRLTHRDGPDITWGLPEFVAQEEMDRFEGHWWSPDGRTLAVQRTDVSAVERLRVMDPANPAAPPEVNPYPRPGHVNADVSLALVPVTGGEPVTVSWDRTAMPYLCRIVWPEHGPLTLYVMDRAQQHATLLAVDAATGRTSPLLGEQDERWLNLPAGAPRWLADGRTFLWISERDDTGPALELQRADGSAQRLTPPGLRVHELLGVDETRGRAWMIAGQEPEERHLWYADLRKAPHVGRATADAGVENATLAADASARLRVFEPVRGARQWTVETAEGKPLGALRSLAETPSFEPNVTFERVGPDSLAAFVVRPRDFDPRRRYPVVDWAYAGPHSQRVQHAAGRYVLEQWLADRGFIVVTVDGRGTPARGRTWERTIRGDLIGPALADHIAGLRELCARHAEMDGDRIGAFGWSFGGYFAAQAVLHAPDTYRVAVAGAPVVDWLDYDTFYTERYLGVPTPGSPDSIAYARSSVLDRAATLSRPLLVIHGTSDDNVLFLHTLRLADALNRANRAWSLLPLLGQTHAVADPAQLRQEYGRAADFLRAALGAPTESATPRP